MTIVDEMVQQATKRQDAIRSKMKWIDESLIELITACGSTEHRNRFFKFFDKYGNIDSYDQFDCISFALDTLHSEISTSILRALQNETDRFSEIDDYEFGDIIKEDYDFGLMILLYKVVLLCQDSNSIALAYAAFTGMELPDIKSSESVIYGRFALLRRKIHREVREIINSLSAMENKELIKRIEDFKKKGGVK